MILLSSLCYIFNCSVESQEVLDAELSARVLRLINVTDSGMHSQGKPWSDLFI